MRLVLAGRLCEIVLEGGSSAVVHLLSERVSVGMAAERQAGGEAPVPPAIATVIILLLRLIGRVLRSLLSYSLLLKVVRIKSHRLKLPILRVFATIQHLL